MSEQPTDWMRGFIVREDIPKFALNEHTDAERGTRHFLNFTMSKLREPDRAGNTHTLYCQEYDPETKRSVGDKIYIGKMKPVRSWNSSSSSQTPPPESSGTPDLSDDLPF